MIDYVFVYVLLSEGVPFYVGSTKNSLSQRLSQHKVRGIQQYTGGMDSIELIALVHENDRVDAETAIISLCESSGWPLINKAPPHRQTGAGKPLNLVCREEGCDERSVFSTGLCKGHERRRQRAA